MPQASLKLDVFDLAGDPIAGQIDIDFAPARNSPGGAPMEASFVNDEATRLIVEDIECRGGPGTLYTVRINTRNFRPYAFFQILLERQVNTPSESTIRLLVNPKKVKDIAAPTFTGLPAAERRWIESASMVAPAPEDRDLLGLSGSALYDALGPMRKACLLNLAAKAKHATAGKCFRFLGSLIVLRPDRCFCAVDKAMPDFLRKSDRFKSAPSTLHEPLQDYVLEDSFKSQDAHANLQVTFMRHKTSGELAADVDIDESSGIEHGFEVIRNAVTKGRTNPYLVRELLLLSEPVERTLDPGYRFLFGG